MRLYSGKGRPKHESRSERDERRERMLLLRTRLAQLGVIRLHGFWTPNLEITETELKLELRLCEHEEQRTYERRD
jgi:hypothetical protein